MSNNSAFVEKLEAMKQLHQAKNADYSEGGEFKNFEESLRVGVEPWRGSFVRLQDKYTRCCNLMNGHEAQVSDERLKDTLMDLANYAVITLTLLEREETERQEDELTQTLLAGAQEPSCSTCEGERKIAGVYCADCGRLKE